MLKIEHLSKNYPAFSLKDVSFSVPKGYIVGFIGRNGAGKTTTLKCIMNAVKADSGKITVFGKDAVQNETEIKQRIGFSLGEADYYKNYKIKHVTGVYKRFYKNWNENSYEKYIRKFNLDENKKINELSSGMRVKYALTLALSHNAELFIFDEPTSGLDPVSRDEISDVFQELVEDGEKSILFSTHITSDLDKIADYIVFIRNGEIIVSDEKDNILDSHIMIYGKKSEIEKIQNSAIGYKENRFGFTALMKKADLPDGNFETAKPNLEDIMIYYDKEYENA